jgi:hypothetical protein
LDGRGLLCAGASEQTDRLPVATQHGDRQRRAPFVVDGIDIGTQLDQACQDLVVWLATEAIRRRDRGVYRRLLVLES